MRRNLAKTRPAFTLTELLVVIVVVVLLTTMVVTGTSSAIDLARKRNTSVTMANTMLAIETFATDNPLRQVYDRSSPLTANAGSASGASFGPYPPYQMAVTQGINEGASGVGNVTNLFMAPAFRTQRPNAKDTSIANRLYYDLAGRSETEVFRPQERDRYVYFPNPGSNTTRDGNDDNRALSAYLQLFSPRAFEQISRDSLRPLDPLAEVDRTRADRVDPNPRTGSLAGRRNDGIDILGIHDGWGVPLDYLMYVKIGVTLKRHPTQGTMLPSYTILDRRPVLRSRGMNRETYDRYREAIISRNYQTAAALNDPTRWMWSEPLPSPAVAARPSQGAFGVDVNGSMNPRNLPGAAGAAARFRPGWVRLVADELGTGTAAAAVNPAVDYGYLPAFDPGQ